VPEHVFLVLMRGRTYLQNFLRAAGLDQSGLELDDGLLERLSLGSMLYGLRLEGFLSLEHFSKTCIGFSKSFS